MPMMQFPKTLRTDGWRHHVTRLATMHGTAIATMGVQAASTMATAASELTARTVEAAHRPNTPTIYRPQAQSPRPVRSPCPWLRRALRQCRVTSQSSMPWTQWMCRPGSPPAPAAPISSLWMSPHSARHKNTMRAIAPPSCWVLRSSPALAIFLQTRHCR